VDQAKVQRQVEAYLLQRGQDLAKDQGLGHVQDQDLIELGRLDCIARAPEVSPGLAVHLAMIMHEREHRAQDQTAPEPGTTATPEIREADPSVLHGQAGTSSAAREQPKRHDRNGKNEQID
jgi:hypothetical protein